MAATSGSHGRVRTGLAAAAATLVGQASPAQVSAPATELDSALLIYAEGRVAAYEITADARHHLSEDRVLTGRFQVDILTGASPNGATPSSLPQTFTRPSGRGSYRVSPGDTPLDDTFQDNRFALTVGYAQPFGRNLSWNVGAGGSIEYDYLALHGSTGVSRDLFRKNTTLSAGVSYSYDTWSPEGGIPVPFASMTRPRATPPRLADTDEKKVLDVVAGVTQVLSRLALVRVNYSLNLTEGYLTDPFKLLSVVRRPSDALPGLPADYVFEHRPGVRHRHSVYTQFRRRVFRSDVLDLSYRFGWDTWSIQSHTAELRYRHTLSETDFLQPRLRIYHQSAAEFYRRFLVEVEELPSFASADYRLAEFDAATLGFEWGRRWPSLGLISMTLEYYGQFNATGGPVAFGELTDTELYPALHAVMFRLRYSGGW